MTEKDYTDEQVVSVGRIKKCKDYYEILEVSKDATEAEIKKKYRKLALALHPDKNKAPGAIEAFKAVGNAFAVLSDKDKRKQYDMYGSEPQNNSSSSRDGFATYNYSRGFDADISPEEIFNMFFGGAFPTSSIYVRRNNYNRYRHYRQDQESYGQQDPNLNTFLFQFAPILLLIVLSVFSTYLTPDAVFMLNRSSKYSVERETERFQIKYFVKDNFEANYGSVINEVEASVINEYISVLRSKCYKERNHQEAMIWKAKAYRDVELERRAKEFRQPSCEKLYQFSNLSY